MHPSIKESILEKKDEIVEQWLEEIEQFRYEDYLQNISDSVYRSTNREFVDKIFETVDLCSDDVYERISQYSERLIQLGWPLNYITRGLQSFRQITVETLSNTGDNYCYDIEFYQEIESWIDNLINALVSDYSGSWENTVFSQKMALKELSAPLIPVFDEICVMPLIGTIDSERAKLIMENLLEGVIENRAQVVLIDITGVPVVDTMVAHHIIQAAEAVRLVGAECILVGIRPEIAQTVVNLGIDLGKFSTKSTLKKGMATALKMTDREIVDLASK
ncbi:RsbT co-antagonist protein RsbRA [Texcoconibacillus texcoconensis]|uniref:RsbT co-antagonist protein RsbR n=1 Tax=Texcoconibacillus texcoconensis TaxID=1095777 RepID=A0A840QRV0_9BACI|nr:RsbT co-antagonist protein RsbRA [Texcoconibacillus texcoconensis]MBB5174212.1 rsbT co-antagonist protein RsbR [Texcoconibacillus texcoconensis]